MRNALTALRRMDLSFANDIFRHRKTVNGQALQELQGQLSDDAVSALRGMIINAFDFDPRADNVRDAVNQLGLEHTAHPIREMLDALKWDGKPRLDRWLSEYLGAEDTALTSAFGRIVLIAAVRRVRQPGVKFDAILVLEGPQGSGKSTAIRILAGDGFHSDQDILAADPKTQMELMEGIWIYELGELGSLNRAKVNRTKAFASRHEDHGRMAYARFKDTRPRQLIFIGTTNEQTYLRDATGNRRFWPVRTTHIDLPALQRDRDQLLAEASHREAADESIELPRDLWPAAAEEQAERMEADPWLAVLVWVRGSLHGDVYRITTAEALAHLDMVAGQQTPAHGKRLASVMRDLGWESDKFKVGGQTVRGYKRAKELDPGEMPSPAGMQPFRPGTGGWRWHRWRVPQCAGGVGPVREPFLVGRGASPLAAGAGGRGHATAATATARPAPSPPAISTSARMVSGSIRGAADGGSE